MKKAYYGLELEFQNFSFLEREYRISFEPGHSSAHFKIGDRISTHFTIRVRVYHFVLWRDPLRSRKEWKRLPGDKGNLKDLTILILCPIFDAQNSLSSFDFEGQITLNSRRKNRKATGRINRFFESTMLVE